MQVSLIAERKKRLNLKKTTPPAVRSVTEYGNSVLLNEAMKDIKPLLMEGFPEEPEKDTDALAMLRTSGNVPLKRVESSWEKLYNVELIEPDLKPNSLSRMLHSVGVNREGHQVVFKSLLDHS